MPLTCTARPGEPRGMSPHRLLGNRTGTVTTTKEATVPTAHVNGIDIEYVTSGDPADPRSFSSWDWVRS
jgi:hypothetical protein